MLIYLKSSASAIITAVFSLSFIHGIMNGDFLIDQIYFIILYASVFGYLFGLLGVAFLFLIKHKGYTSSKSYFIFLFLGVIIGDTAEFIM
ncbi:hypothetical protein [Bacillus sp. 37MA]|uniref:hypothetical protein n=1 Tax=Bacillus sp. 37MA TaxID=1132442 RepID=UPI00037F9160|nr:hypothetical protein [Bacillus sp. 37MA]